MMRLLKIFLLLWFVVGSVYAQETYRTEVLNDDIKTLQVKVNNDPMQLPIILLNGDEVLNISFDEMSHEGKRFSYSVEHLNYDWTKSSLAESEYINGFANDYIVNSELSVNTTFLYTHYSFSLPNENTNFMISGNYVVNIFENSNTRQPIARVCFSIVEPKVQINAKVRGNTDTEINNTKQQLDFEVNTSGTNVQDARTEIKAVVRQNGRVDNQRTDLQPTYYAGNLLKYVNNSELIFEGGNEYRRFDFSSIYNFDDRIQDVQFDRPYYHVYLSQSQPMNGQPYQLDYDANGKFVVNYQHGYNSDVDADYMFVHFYLPIKAPLKNGKIYIGGDWNYNLLNENSLMKYNSEHKLYYQTLLLKQGGYNYQYWYLPNDSSKALTQPIEGSHWQTQNEYAIYIYYRPWGGRYDQLIGVQVIK